MRMPFAAIVERAQHAEVAGFTGIALMDHLAPPLAEDKAMYEAITTATWIAAHTTTLKIGHLVLCDGFRPPALLARQAVSLDHASNGRFELGLGSGSMPSEFRMFGFDAPPGPARLRRLAETLDVLRLLWSGERFDYEGEFHRLHGAQQQPTPLERIPILLGGAGDAVVELAAAHAEWWNLPMYALDRLGELRPRTAPARTSIQQMVAYIADEARRSEIAELANRRLGGLAGGPLVASAAELVEHFTSLHEQGVDRFYVWFADFAELATLRDFGENVITGCRG